MKLFQKASLITIFFLFKFGFGHCQHSIIKHYTLEDGMASNHVYTILQDKKGFIWLATDNGVSRFDGKKFKNFNASDGLPDNDIVDFKEDNKGRIWVCCYNGASCFIEGNKVHNPNNDTLLSKFKSNEGYYKFIELNKKLCITYQNGIGVEVSEKTERKKFKFNQNSFGAYDHIIDIGIGNLRKIKLFDEHYVLLDSFENKNSPIKRVIEKVEVSENNKFLAFLNDKTCLTFSIDNKKLKLVDSTKLPFKISFTYRFKNQLWGVSEGIGIIPLLLNGQQDFSRKIQFPNKLVHRFLIDKEGNYWGCTPGNGIYMIPNKGISVYDESDGLYQNSILKLASTLDSELFLGFNNSQIQGIIKNKIIDYKNKIPKSVNGKTTAICANKDYIVNGTHEQLIVVHKKTGIVNTINIPTIKSCLMISKDTLIVGAHGGCYFVKLPCTVFDTIFCKKSMALYYDKSEGLYVGNLNTLLHCSKNKNNKWEIDSPLSKLNTDLSISAITKQGKRFILGTKQKGIVAIEDTIIQNINLGDELKNINCNSLSQDKNGNIWACSYLGIHKITFKNNIHQYSIKNYRKNNGLPYEDINDLKIVNDTIYAACASGLLKLVATEEDSSKEKKYPSTYITDIKTNNQSLVSEKLQETYKLPSNKSSLIIEFSGIDFRSLGNIQFKYRLKGLNDKWQITKENMIRYESLPWGTYTFEVITINSDGIASKTPASVTITIDKSWWQRWPFILLCCILFLAISTLLFRYFFNLKHQKQLKEASLKKQVAEIELKAIKAQINPHFIFNTLNSIQYFIGNQKTDEAELYLSKLGSLLRKTLDFSSKSEVTIEDEIKYLDNYLQLEKLRFDDSFHYIIRNNLPSNLSEQIKIPPMVLQPHIENALKHSFQGIRNRPKQIKIQFDYKDEKIICTVEDNGIGRKASLDKKRNIALSYTSKGIELSEAKLEMFEKLTGKNVQTEIVDLYENETAIGTKIMITINLSNK